MQDNFWILPPEQQVASIIANPTAQDVAAWAALPAETKWELISSLEQPAPAPVQTVSAAEVAAAREYLLDEVAKGVGLPNADALRQGVSHMQSVSQQLQEQAEVEAQITPEDAALIGFRQSNPEYYDCPENSNAVVSFLDRGKLPTSVEGLNKAWQQVRASRETALALHPDTPIETVKAWASPPQQPMYAEEYVSVGNKSTDPVCQGGAVPPPGLTFEPYAVHEGPLPADFDPETSDLSQVRAWAVRGGK